MKDDGMTEYKTLIAIFMFALAIICYTDTDDEKTERCSVEPQMKYIFRQMICSASLVGVLWILYPFKIIFAKEGEDSFLHLLTKVAFIIETIIQFVFLVILLTEDSYVADLRIHECDDVGSVIVMLQVLPMIYFICYLIFGFSLLLMGCIYSCIFALS